MRKRRAYVVESTDQLCSDCKSDGRAYDHPNIGIWLKVEWSPGSFAGPSPLGRPADLVLCSSCRWDAEIGQLIGPELPA